jgi:hypothetical protein
VRGICDLGSVPQSGTAGWQRGALDRYEGRNNPLLKSHSPEQLGKSCESLIASCLVGGVAIAEALTETHESVICTFVCDGIIEFTGCFHFVCSRRNAGESRFTGPSIFYFVLPLNDRRALRSVGGYGSGSEKNQEIDQPQLRSWLLKK